jgi:hypothetical protein
MGKQPHQLESFYDPVRKRIVKFPEHWPLVMRSYFLNELGRWLSGQAIERVLAEREHEETS